MEVTFYKLIERRVSTWDARRGRTVIPGTTMALGRGGAPHDLLQMIVEATVGVDRGFWGSLAAGATFRSTGRTRTRPGKAVIAANRAQLDEAEHIVGDHLRRWATGAQTPCTTALDTFDEAWRQLGDRERLVVTWPTLEKQMVSYGIQRHARR